MDRRERPSEAEGRLAAIWLKRRRRGPMDPVAGVEVRARRGLAGNADQGGRRQVTFLERERWEAVTGALGVSLEPGERRANVLLEGIRLERSRGRVLRVGECRFRILGETRPCERMDEACPGLLAALRPEWGGGAFGEALDDGRIAVGDAVCWEEDGPEAR